MAENITKAQANVGLYPFNLYVVLSQLSKAPEPSLTDRPTTSQKSIQHQTEYYTPTDSKAVQELISAQFLATKVIDYMAKAAIKAMADVITKRAINQELFEAIKHKKARLKHTTANLGKA